MHSCYFVSENPSVTWSATPKTSHFYTLGTLFLHCVVRNASGGDVITVHWCGRLSVAHSLEGLSLLFCILCNLETILQILLLLLLRQKLRIPHEIKIAPFNGMGSPFTGTLPMKILWPLGSLLVILKCKIRQSECLIPYEMYGIVPWR